MNVKGVKNFVGIPYQQMNCWDLACAFYKDILGIELLHVTSDPKDRNATRDLIYSNIGGFRKVSEPNFGDLILIRMRGIESHIGVYVGKGMMLHTSETTDAVLDRVERWARSVVGFYRPKDTAE